MNLDALSAVSSTALWTLHGRALGPLVDPEADRLVTLLTPALAASDVPMHQALRRWGVPFPLRRYLSMRAAHFDLRARTFVAQHPDGIVVNLAAGLDTRFHRLGGRIEVIDVDLPPMIALKRSLFSTAEGYRLVEGSVTERGWLAEIPTGRPTLFLAEGLFMYLPPSEVSALLLDLTRRRPGSELVAEVFQARWLARPFDRVVQRGLRQALRFDGDVVFRGGIRNSQDFEALGHGIRLLGDWSWLDPVPGGRVPLLRHTMWVVHYALGAAAAQ